MDIECIIFIILGVLFISILITCMCRSERFISLFNINDIDDNNKINVFDITGVEVDSCIGHVPAYKHVQKIPKLLELCNATKFSNKELPSHLVKKIDSHNKGEICLTGCLKTWEERREELYNLLSKISKVCKKLELPWVLYYGGLLGYSRDKQLIPWDADIDILMPEDFRERFKDDIVYEDDDIILEIVRNSEHIMGLFVDKKALLYCDIFYWKEDGDNVLVSWIPKKFQSKFLKIPKDKFYPLQDVTMNGIDIVVPSDIEYNLKTRYEDYKELPYNLNNGKYYKK